MLGVQELVDEGLGFIAGELASSLTLGEAHGSSGVAEIGVTRVGQELQKLLHLLTTCRWSGCLTKCHGGSLIEVVGHLRHAATSLG